jgi:hypothetical protein
MVGIYFHIPLLKLETYTDIDSKVSNCYKPESMKLWLLKIWL